MNNLLNLLLVAGAVVCVYAAQGIYPAEPKPPAFADQEGCYLSQFNAVLPFDKPYYPKDNQSCEQYDCMRSGDTLVSSCGVYNIPSNCRLVQDFTLDYPMCCGEIVCDPVAPPAVDGKTIAATTLTKTEQS